MTLPVVAHSWDPYHGDPNNRFPRLGAPVKRVVAREDWFSPALYMPALPSPDARPALHFDHDGWTTYSEAA